MHILSLLALVIADEILVERVDPVGTFHFSLMDVYQNGMYSAVFRGVFIDDNGCTKEAVVKYALAAYDASCVGGLVNKIPCTSIGEELAALRTLSPSPHVVRVLGTTAASPATRYVGNFHVVSPGIVLERLRDTVQGFVASAEFWRKISEGFHNVAQQLQCLHVQIFTIVAEIVENFHIYSSDPSMSNVLLTDDVWRDGRRLFACPKLKMIDYGLVVSAATNDAKLAALALTFTRLDEHANSVRHIPGLALIADDDQCEPFRTIRESGNVHDATYFVGPDSLAIQEISEFVRKFPPIHPSHALAVCGELADWTESWCGALTAAIRSSSSFPISV